MEVLNKNTVVVDNFLELKESLENVNDYTYIYLNGDITLTSGILINNSKVEVIIDGIYNETMHEYIDQKKLGTNDTLRVNTNTKKVIFKNTKMTGYNYYGIVYVPNNSAYKDVVIEYNNIIYVGPQISYNPYGKTRFIDCIITIQDNYASGNEIAECNVIEIGGLTSINHNSKSNSAFWFRNSNPSFTILSGSTVHFYSEYRELFYGTYNLTFNILKDSSFYVTTYNGLAYNTFGTGTTLIDENSLFSLTKTNYNGNYSTWYSYGVITVNKGSTLNIINNYSNITTNNYNIYFMGNNVGFNLNNPEKVVLYNSTANIINTQNSCPFSFTFNRLNLFNSPVSINDNITKNTLPDSSFYKNEISNITGTFTSSETIVLSSNYDDLSNFNFPNKKIFSIGLFPFTVSPLTDTDNSIHGLTEPNTSILIEFKNTSVVVVSDEFGNFSYYYSNPLSIGTVITFNAKSYQDVLYYTKEITIVYSGELSLISASKSFTFELRKVSSEPILCPRANELLIIVVDSRINSSDWKLYASISNDLESSDGDILENSLVFVDENDNIYPLSSVPTLVYTGYNNQGMTTTTYVDFEENRGILFRVLKPLEINKKYETFITWTLEE